jgi:hypothetical protein
MPKYDIPKVYISISQLIKAYFASLFKPRVSASIGQKPKLVMVKNAPSGYSSSKDKPRSFR